MKLYMKQYIFTMKVILNNINVVFLYFKSNGKDN